MKFDHSYASQLTDLGTRVKVSPIADAHIAIINHSLSEALEIDQLFVDKKRFLDDLFSGKGPLNKQPMAQKYGGHQFGSWNPELGDGRGVLLTEVIDSNNQRWDLHLKGAGKTPYSRSGDGRAVLRSTIREYLASEALHALGIPTSRALCLISGSESVQREQIESAAMLIRTCQSHIRFGHFEYFYHSKQTDKLQALFDYTFKYHFPHHLDTDCPHRALLQQIVDDTARLIALWQAFGFNHGVMNTDNMSIHGITFDFGPYAFLDEFEPEYICNHSDHSGRYSFDNQPGIALWNLNALAHSFTPYLPIDEIRQVLSSYEPQLQKQYRQIMSAKFGFFEPAGEDLSLVNDWLALLADDKRDYTQSFRKLCDINLLSDNQSLVDHFVNRQQIQTWLSKYQKRLATESVDHEYRKRAMRKHNPLYILRNYLAQHVINAAQEGDFSHMESLLKVLQKPFDEQQGQQKYCALPPDWGKAMEISCSS